MSTRFTTSGSGASGSAASKRWSKERRYAKGHVAQRSSRVRRRLQHPAHVQHAHKRPVLRRHRIHRRLPEPGRKHLALPRAPGDPAPPIRQHHRPFPSLQLRPRPNLIALCATVSHRNRRVSFSCLPDRAAIATVERRMRSSATRRALCWPSPSTPYQGSRVP